MNLQLTNSLWQVKILHGDLAKEKDGVHEYEDRIVTLEKQISSQHQALRFIKDKLFPVVYTY